MANRKPLVVVSGAYRQLDTGADALDASIAGNAATVTNGVYTTGNQTIGGIKTISNDIGSTYGGDFRLYNAAAGATNPSKPIRINPTGALEFINNAYSAVIASLTDAGTFNATGLTVGGSQVLNIGASSSSNLGVVHTTKVNSNEPIATLPDGVTCWEAQGNGTGAAVITFHRPSAYAAFFGLDTDNKWKVGGWSMGDVSYEILHQNNYTTYTVTKTGTGASGTWGISVTGNAATVTSITSGQVTTALGFTPYNATNPSGYTSNTGTVTSVGLSLPAELTVSGSPVTGSGTLSAVWANQSASGVSGKVFAGPVAGSAAPTFRVLLSDDIPALNISKITNLQTTLDGKAPLASPTFTGTPVLPTTTTIGASGPVVGYRDIPITVQNATYGFVLADAGKGFGKDNGTAYTYTIPANGTTAFPIGTAITVFNNNATSNITIAITTDTLRLGGTTSTGSRTLAPFGVCTLLKVASTVWIASGPGLT